MSTLSSLFAPSSNISPADDLLTLLNLMAGIPSGGSVIPCSLELPLDVYETDTHFVVEADAPGVTRDNIKVTHKNRALTIIIERAEKHSCGSKETKESTESSIDASCPIAPTAVKPRWHMAGLRYGKFTRTITLPATADISDVTSTLENGVMRLKFGKKLETVTEIPIY